MNIKPTLAPNEFTVTEWNAIFLFSAADKSKQLSVNDAELLIKAEIDKQFEIFLTHRIKNKHHTIIISHITDIIS